MNAGGHRDLLHTSQEAKLTTGVVQKEIRKGMTQAEVAKHLGSPNLVTRDKNGLETWVYDKMSRDVSYSSSAIGGAGGSALIIAGASQSGAAATTQRTLTVIIKFENNLVEELTYNASSF